MSIELKKRFVIFIATLSSVLLMGGVILILPSSAAAISDSLQITGEGVNNPTIFTLDQLEQMEQNQYLYSCINTWPTKKWYVGQGVKLYDLLKKAEMTDEATLLKFYSADGYTVTMTIKELFEDKRYRFPHFKSGKDSDGHISGDPADKVEVEAIVGLITVEGSDKPGYMNDLNSLLLMMGQRTVSEQTGNLFVKYLNKIEVLTSEPEKWDAPRANPDSGIVYPGTMVALSNINSDDDKIHYTTDGSDPTMYSPVYNWIASRWWTARADVLGRINHPLGPIDEDTTIKAITIGPGKLNSDVSTFTYRVGEETVEDIKLLINLGIGTKKASINGVASALDAEPFLNPEVGRTLVPLRFIGEALGAEVEWDPESQKVTVNQGDKEIILVIDSTIVFVNGIERTIDCAPAIMPPGRTFIPLRFVSETLEAEVVYDPDTGQILITR